MMAIMVGIKLNSTHPYSVLEAHFFGNFTFLVSNDIAKTLTISMSTQDNLSTIDAANGAQGTIQRLHWCTMGHLLDPMLMPKIRLLPLLLPVPQRNCLPKGSFIL